MNQAINIIHPHTSAVVNASAGTGKTWLLVSRVIRLLLDGNHAGGILAITFTRKAAAEMQDRLLQRLRLLATCPEEELKKHLTAVGAGLDVKTLAGARRLYETYLHSLEAPRLTTFHAFCQDILKRFPLEAEVPPGFELLDRSRLIEDEALTALYDEISLEPKGTLASAINELIEYSGSIFTLTNLLRSFLQNRTDWWAYTLGHSNPSTWAAQRLQEAMEIHTDEDPFAEGLSRIQTPLAEFATLILGHNTATNKTLSAKITEVVLDPKVERDERFRVLKSCFINKTGEGKSFKGSKAVTKSLGETQAQRYLELALSLQQAVMEMSTRENTLRQFKVTKTWYTLGHQLVLHYQRIKSEQRLLDFSDLEWKTFQLINYSNHAHWIQYKLDQRIDHILVDEFQDTNPTQWYLLQPLLQEFAHEQASENRSVFLVGDPKQSIYSFRRAEPLLFAQAETWLQTNLQALTHSHDLSRRSAPAILDLVNLVFGSLQQQSRFGAFRPHETVHHKLWGGVEIMPFLGREDSSTEKNTAINLRHPLTQAPEETEDDLYLLEGNMIAERILRLVNSGVSICQDELSRPVTFNDILILIPSRTHVHHYEQALRQHGIPYIGANRGTLLDCPEVKDIVALLQFLSTPFNNIALARVLKSPVFECTDADLVMLAQQPQESGTWLERMRSMATSAEPEKWQEIFQLLQNWRQLAGRLPVHDLLDQIFHQGRLLEKYSRCLPIHLRQRARSNFEQLLNLSLDMDAGRYPSLHRFLNHLTELGSLAKDAPDEGQSGGVFHCVHIMTVHGAKGLESPVVFIADTGSARQSRKAHDCIVDWPPEASTPEAFLLNAHAGNNSPYVQQKLEHLNLRDDEEELNLLYVALTRARQFLFISGTEAKKSSKKNTWYEHITNALELAAADLQTYTNPDFLLNIPTEETSVDVTEVKKAAAEKLVWPAANMTQYTTEIAPSYRMKEQNHVHRAEHSLLKGNVIHRALEFEKLLLQDESALAENLKNEFCLADTDERLQTWVEEAKRVATHPDFPHLFRHGSEYTSYTEVPLIYVDDNGDTVNGIIDRLTLGEKHAYITDYKTHTLCADENPTQLAQSYQQQMQYYADGIRLLYPDKHIEGYILFTSQCQLIRLV